MIHFKSVLLGILGPISLTFFRECKHTKSNVIECTDTAEKSTIFSKES